MQIWYIWQWNMTCRGEQAIFTCFLYFPEQAHMVKYGKRQWNKLVKNKSLLDYLFYAGYKLQILKCWEKEMFYTVNQFTLPVGRLLCGFYSSEPKTKRLRSVDWRPEWFWMLVCDRCLAAPLLFFSRRFRAVPRLTKTPRTGYLNVNILRYSTH